MKNTIGVYDAPPLALGRGRRATGDPVVVVVERSQHRRAGSCPGLGGPIRTCGRHSIASRRGSGTGSFRLDHLYKRPFTGWLDRARSRSFARTASFLRATPICTGSFGLCGKRAGSLAGGGRRTGCAGNRGCKAWRDSGAVHGCNPRGRRTDWPCVAQGNRGGASVCSGGNAAGLVETHSISLA